MNSHTQANAAAEVCKITVQTTINMDIRSIVETYLYSPNKLASNLLSI